MGNGSGETVQDAQRGQNRQAEPGGEYFVYFWTGRGGPAKKQPGPPRIKYIFFLFCKKKKILNAPQKKNIKKIKKKING
ncbi:hypothetical protein, partial [Klebsiella pneumoniae]|uniref:hypothetical protein n=1 Tax=Klebsiella pneumoniae TaxID=573 RepID=UPI001054B2BA